MDSLVVVSSDGNVLWVPASTFNVLCPFQKSHLQIKDSCSIKIGSWTYDQSKVDLGFYDDLEEVNLNNYVPSTHLFITGTNAKKNTLYYPCCPEAYVDMLFNISFVRFTEKSVGVTFALVVCQCMTSLSVFWLPPSYNARLLMGNYYNVFTTMSNKMHASECICIRFNCIEIC